MLSASYILKAGDLIRRRLWATCKFGSLEELGAIWRSYGERRIDLATYYQQAANLLPE